MMTDVLSTNTSAELPPPPPLQGVIAGSGLEVSYRMGTDVVAALRGVSLQVRPGERVFLCGPSGAGKTTLLYVLGGLEHPTAGSVVADGQPLYTLSRNALATFRNNRMGYVFQNYGLLPEFTALENVLMPALIGGRAAKERALELLTMVGLAERKHHQPSQLSGGECQRVAIARALINDPQFIFADEPTGNLDSRTGSEIMTLLLDVAKNHGKTLLVVTHDTKLAQRGDRILWLRDGQLESVANAEAA